jgi:hypothetical protein
MRLFASLVCALAAVLAAHSATAQTFPQADITSASPTLAETHWVGHVTWNDHASSGEEWTLYFRSDGVLVYGANGAMHDTGAWHQRNMLLTFDTDDSTHAGRVRGDAIEGIAYNQDGEQGAWSFHRDTASVFPCPSNMVALRGTTAPLVCICPQNVSPGTVWGEATAYTDDSDVCTAAVHAGIITASDGGHVSVTPREGQTSYQGATAHGITTLRYGSWSGSFTITDTTDEKKR